MENHNHQENKRVVDLRSDTVTKPTAAMRSAMFEAEVDDDIVTVDPTMDKLQKQAANMFGKEAGLFVPSGTMGNLICVLVHCEARGSEVILGSESHINVYEQGGISTLGGVFPNVVPNEEDGTMNLTKVEAAIKPLDDEHYPTTRLICIENTQNRCGGRCISVEFTDKIGELAKSYGLKLHIDGARIFNACTALGVSPERLCRAADSVSICLSKGLAAPAGSLVVGSHDFIRKAKFLRKALGGAMRQVGVLAAPGLLALTEMAQRLHEDHDNARKLAGCSTLLQAFIHLFVFPALYAEGLSALEGFRVDLSRVETNIVNVEILSESFFVDAAEVCRQLETKGVLAYDIARMRVRLVTHYQISGDDIDYTISCFQGLVKSAKKNK